MINFNELVCFNLSIKVRARPKLYLATQNCWQEFVRKLLALYSSA